MTRQVRWTADELVAATFPEPRWSVPGILPEGLTVLAGKPKTGKSWLALAVALAVATGGHALGGVKVEPGHAVYLALEDYDRRLQERLTMLLKGEPAPAALTLWTDFPRLPEGIDLLRDEIGPTTRLCVIDTWAKVAPTTDSDRRLYHADTQALEPLQDLAQEHGLAILLLHHMRKMAASDWLDSISGTLGIAGTADTLLGFFRDRGSAGATLRGTGRDLPDLSLALQFDPATGLWVATDQPPIAHLTPEREEVARALIELGRPATPKEIATHLGSSHEAVKKLVQRMGQTGDLESAGSGTWTPLNPRPPSPSVPALTLLGGTEGHQGQGSEAP